MLSYCYDLGLDYVIWPGYAVKNKDVPAYQKWIFKLGHMGLQLQGLNVSSLTLGPELDSQLWDSILPPYLHFREIPTTG